MSQASQAAVGAMCTILAIGTLLHSGVIPTTQLMASSPLATSVTSRPILSRSVQAPVMMPTHRTTSEQVIGGPTKAQSHYTSQPILVQAQGSATPSWAVLPIAALMSAGALLVLAFRTATTKPSTPLSEMAMCAAAGAKRGVYNRAVIKEISNLELEQYLADGYKLLDARPKYERERIYPKDSFSVELVKETGAPAWDPVSFIRKQSASQYAGFFRDLVRNADAIKEADAQFSKDEKLIVVCGQGDRSVALARMLQWEGGYTDLVWLRKGLQTCTDQQLKLLNSVGTNVEIGYKDAALDKGGMLGRMAGGNQ
uniref:Rhodanese domain-containing protein n=1 Tax=Eutreptiella gymnastica TaxID=73025 RepID=A0A7S1I1V0_9EUGL